MRNLMLIAIFVVGCSDPVGSRSLAIAPGTPSTNASVVFIFTTGGTSCSGTVIGPNAVLTANYCVFSGTEEVAPASIRVSTGPSVTSPDATVRVAEVIVESTPMDRMAANQLAILITTEPIGVSAVTLATTPVTVGETVTVVGYGADDSGGSGTKREGSTTVDSLMASPPFIFTAGGASACQGDAGGPLLNAATELVGIQHFTSGGGDGGLPGCPAARVGHVDVVALSSFVNANRDRMPTDAGTPSVDAGTRDAGPADAGTTGTDDGCGCSVVSTSRSATPLLCALFVFVGLRQRRRRG